MAIYMYPPWGGSMLGKSLLIAFGAIGMLSKEGGWLAVPSCYDRRGAALCQGETVSLQALDEA